MATLTVNPATLGARRPTMARMDALVPFCVGLVLFLQFHLVITRAINWDEFWYYSQIQQHAGGSLTLPLQTIHVQLFRWLIGLPGNGVDHIVVGRVVMFGAEILTLAAVGAIAAHFTDRQTGLLCALACLCSIYSFQHGFSFRVDPLAGSLAMCALWVLLKSRLGVAGVVCFASLLGLAGLVTIKVVLLAPAFAGIAWLRVGESDDRLAMVRRLIACGLGSLAAFAVLYNLHAATLAVAPAAGSAGREVASTTSAGATMVGGAADYVFELGVAYPQYLKAHLVKGPLQSLLVLLAPVLIWKSGLNRSRKIALSGMLATALVILFYRNTLPYFYAFLLPPVMCGASVAMQAAKQRYSAAFAAVALALGALVLWVREPLSPIDKQRALVDAAEQIFPRPVAYFDFCAMLARFEKVSPFMTRWGIASYTKSGVPIFREAMSRQTVPLLLAGEQQEFRTFTAMLGTRGPSPYFLPQDAAALRGNYLPFWGPIWLAGKAIPPDGQARSEEFLVPGPYTAHGGAVSVDGKVYRPGEIARIGRGFHRIQSADGRPAKLVWGERLEPPGQPAPEPPYWTDF